MRPLPPVPVMRLLLALALLALAAVAAGCASAPAPEVTILVPWDPQTNASEYQAFMAVIKPFEAGTGIDVVPEVTRGAPQQLEADHAAGNLPDIADLSSIGALDQYMTNHWLLPLHLSLSGFDQPWRGLSTGPKGTVYAVPVKADVQSLLWYRAGSLKVPPTTWAGLEGISRLPGTPWCLGLSSGVVSGWPGADWVADLLLSRYGTGSYTQWLHGTLPWNQQQVTWAWHEWESLLRRNAAVPGGVSGALSTPFNQVLSGETGANAGKCIVDHGALIDLGLPSASGYSFARFPSAAGAAPASLVSGDFMVLLRSDPNARSLIAYLASPQAQRLWVQQPGADAFSADQAVRLPAYPQGPRREIAALLQPGARNTFCFTAVDMMPPDLATAFDNAVRDYVAEPGTLHSLLAGLQKTQAYTGAAPAWSSACTKGSP